MFFIVNCKEREMTDLFVLIGDDGYDGETVLGVYASVPEMADAARAYTGSFATEGFLFEHRVVGAPAEDGFIESMRGRLVL